MQINYWIVKREAGMAQIRCPLCFEWFRVLNLPGEVEVYHFCPCCGKPLFVKEEDKNRAV